jgi:hypothetical protein
MGAGSIIDAHACRGDHVRECIDRIAGFPKLRRTARDDVPGYPEAAGEPPDEEWIELLFRCVVGDDDEEISIAAGLGLAACAASEQPNLLRVVLPFDVEQQCGDRGQIERAAVLRGRSVHVCDLEDSTVQ